MSAMRYQRPYCYHAAMHDSATPPTLFADAVEIPRWLEQDRTTPHATRVRRDRQIAVTLQSSDPVARIRAWWRQLRTQATTPDSGAHMAHRLEHGRRLITVLMVAVGILAGAAAASAVFHYDGTWPVNVVTVLATLVLLQLALILFTLLLMLPGLPGLSAIQSLLGGLNPGAIIAAIYRRIGKLEDYGAVFDWPNSRWTGARGPSAARFARWQMLAWSQLAAVMFNLAALATATALIAFTDLAFGWSTTLDMDSGAALKIASALSSPWQLLWPEAVPSATLIENSRFFRLAAAQPTHVAAGTLTGWWPFLLATLFTYALLPRCLLLLWAMLRLRAATAHLLLDDPQVRALLDRMQAPQVELGAADASSAEEQASMSCGVERSGAKSNPTAAIIWANALPVDAVREWAADHLQWRLDEAHEAGGGSSLRADTATIQRIAALGPQSVAIFVRAWEAPLLDLSDFLAQLRTAIGGSCSLIIVPIGAEGAQATETQRATWSRWTARIADRALYMECGA